MIRQERTEVVRRLFDAPDLQRWVGRQHLVVDVINALNVWVPEIRFLEIGIFSGELSVWLKRENVLPAPVTEYMGVDITLSKVPASQLLEDDVCQYVEMPSTQFWAGTPSNEQWDIIFVDGDHSYEQTFTDIHEAKKHISDLGFILVHDIETQSDIFLKGGPDEAFDDCVDGDDDFRYIRLPYHNEGMGLIFKR